MDILNAGRNLSSSDAYISALHTELSKPAYQQALRILWGNYCISESEQSTSQTAGDNVLHLALRSFNSAFSGLTDTLKAFRYVTTDISPILGISCFEEGLFLDFLLFSIDQVQQLLSIDQWEPVVSGHAAYKAMLDGSATAEIMHDRFFIENTNKITGRTEKIIKYLKADQIHLEYFYTE